jgi:2-hydroxychromene-2-carboxylate isomerase
MRQVNFSIEDRVFVTLEKYGAKKGYKATAFAKLLFEAAFASCVGVQPDDDIDVQVAAAIVLHGAKQDSAAIAKTIGLSEASVCRIIETWRRERLTA